MEEAMKGGKFSQSKGKRGERLMVKKLGPTAKRVGYSYLKTPVDLEIGTWAVAQVKNYTQGGAAILKALEDMQKVAPQHHHFMIFKPARGKWVVAELLEQALGDHFGVAEENQVKRRIKNAESD